MRDKLIFGTIGEEEESKFDEYGYDKTHPGYVFILQARRFTEQHGTLEEMIERGEKCGARQCIGGVCDV